MSSQNCDLFVLAPAAVGQSFLMHQLYAHMKRNKLKKPLLLKVYVLNMEIQP